MRKIGGTIQRRNDEMVGILGADLHTASLPAGEDHYPNADGRGLAARFINPTGLTAWTAHFRPGETTGPGNGSLAAFSWQGAPFTAPAHIEYSRQRDYLGWFHTGAGPGRFFLSRPITNSAAAWQNKTIVGRMAASYRGAIGLRVDDGTDNNYVEIYLDATAEDGGQRLRFSYRSGGGTITTNTAVPVTLQGTNLMLRLTCVYMGGMYYLYGYNVDESGTACDIPSFIIRPPWCPAAGRVGLVGSASGPSNYQTCDWFYTDFG